MTKCFFCDCELTKSKGGKKRNSWTKDHLIPRGRGGKGLKNNTVDACRSCNADKGNLTLDEYRIVLAFRWNLLELPDFKFPGEIADNVNDTKDAQ